MRFLFTVFGGGTHLHPLVPLAWACRVAGHDVRLAGTPQYLDDLYYSGLPSIAVGGTSTYPIKAAAAGAPEPWPADWPRATHRLDAARRACLAESARCQIGLAAPMAVELIECTRAWVPDVVVYDSVSYAGAVVAAVLGVPAVAHRAGPGAALRRELAIPGGEPLPEYVELFERFGADVADGEPVSTVDPTPPSLRLPPDGRGPGRVIDVRYVPYNGAGMAPEGLRDAGSAFRVCLIWDQRPVRPPTDAAADPYREAIDHIARAGVEVVVIARAEQVRALGELPANVRAFAGSAGPNCSVPLHLVLPYCDAVVHSGGAGATLTAAALGVPQLAISGSPGRDVTGGRVAACGAGVHLRHQQVRDDPAGAKLISSTVDALIRDPAYRAAAERLRAEVERQPSPADVVPVLVAVASGRDPD